MSGRNNPDTRALQNSLFGDRMARGPGGGSPAGPGLPGRQVQQRPPPNNQAPPPAARGGYDAYSQQPSYNQRPPAPSGGLEKPPRGGPAPYPNPRQYQPQQASQMRLEQIEIPKDTQQNKYIFGNICGVSPNDFPSGSDIYLLIKGDYKQKRCVVKARPTPSHPPGTISLSDVQRTWADVGKTENITAELYDPYAQGGAAYAGSLDVEMGFARPRQTTDVPFDQDQLTAAFTDNFENHVLAPGQRLLFDFQNIPFYVDVKTITLVDLTMQSPQNLEPPVSSNPEDRGVVTTQTTMVFYSNPKAPVKFKASKSRPAANAIITPDFKFESMGIGGLDSEFSTIFRRAFASRIFPPQLVEKLGIMHVKGMLLYGPPGTGKTLIARQIGKMLNAREPKVINGPEVLNKYVGQSEENIRKLFADAEKEYKEKGDESGLHIIIFDELDAVCKQRGSGAGGGTGVGDSVVNQLLSKLDGVDQLNNILLIGMTNRKDMIDDALLRPGRLEVQIEISLPDEFGRNQILNIHTAKMKENEVMGDDVDIAELAALTKNFSGAELSGLVKSATSFAFSRNIKAGTTASVSEDVVNMKVTHQDFLNALNEVKAAFGADESELQDTFPFGIVSYSNDMVKILDAGRRCYDGVRKQDHFRHTAVLIHGPPGSGKTALAAYLASKSDYPFIKMVSPATLVGFRDEMAKKDHLHRIFADAYKSPLSLLILDNIERLIEWNPVGPRLSNSILQALITLLQTPPPHGHRLLILATTSQMSVLDQLDVTVAFQQQIYKPPVRNTEELAYLLDYTKVFEREEDGGNGNGNGAQARIRYVVDSLRQATGTDSVEIGVKTVLAAAETARFDAEGGIDWFVEQLEERIQRRLAVVG